MELLNHQCFQFALQKELESIFCAVLKEQNRGLLVYINGNKDRKDHFIQLIRNIFNKYRGQILQQYGRYIAAVGTKSVKDMENSSVHEQEILLRKFEHDTNWIPPRLQKIWMVMSDLFFVKVI